MRLGLLFVFSVGSVAMGALLWCVLWTFGLCTMSAIRLWLTLVDFGFEMAFESADACDH